MQKLTFIGIAALAAMLLGLGGDSTGSASGRNSSRLGTTMSLD